MHACEPSNPAGRYGSSALPGCSHGSRMSPLRLEIWTQVVHFQVRGGFRCFSLPRPHCTHRCPCNDDVAEGWCSGPTHVPSSGWIRQSQASTGGTGTGGGGQYVPIHPLGSGTSGWAKRGSVRRGRGRSGFQIDTNMPAIRCHREPVTDAHCHQ